MKGEIEIVRKRRHKRAVGRAKVDEGGVCASNIRVDSSRPDQTVTELSVSKHEGE